MRTLTLAIAASSLLFASLMACGESTPPPNAPVANGPEKPADPNKPGFTNPAPNGDGGAGPTASDKPAADKPVVKEPESVKFDSLPKDKKVEIMAQKVVPNVGKDFKDYDAKRFANFGCATCHGPKKNEDPHKVLPKLTMSNGGFEKMQKNKPEIVKFMMEKVTPDMATALGEKAFDPATHTGFGCGGCHEVK